jgi:hypothetical protein
MTQAQKAIHFTIPETLWERFYLAFPYRGQRKALLVECIERAVEYTENNPSIVERIFEDWEEE